MHGNVFLFHCQHQTFQIRSFRVENVDGVVGGLRQLVDDANVALGLYRRCSDDALEGGFVDGLRAAEGE